jgi:hypothetical protein
MAESRFEQPTRRIGGGGGRGRLWLVGWAVTLVAVVAVAVNGASSDDARPIPAVADGSPSAPQPGGSSGPELLILTDPSGAEVQTVALRVRGRVREPIAYVEVVLVHVETALVRQITRPTRRGLFAALFTVGAPRSAATVTIRAIGRDTGGAEVASVEREVSLAALAGEPRAQPTPTRPPIGEDGLMGGLPFDFPEVSPAPVLAPSPAPASWSWPVGRLGWQANPVQR